MGRSRCVDDIQELDLENNLSNGQVEILHIIEDDEGKFSLSVKLNWRDVYISLVTQRKEIKRWANMQTLVGHIKSHYACKHFPKIVITLYGVQNE